MRKLALLLAPALALIVLAPTTPDHKVTVKAGTTVTIQGGLAEGVNLGYSSSDPEGSCTHDPDAYCETVLIEYTNKKSGKRPTTITMTPTNPAADFDIYAFESDKTGKYGKELGRCGGAPLTGCSSADAVEQFTTPNPTSEESVTFDVKKKKYYVRVNIVYFLAPSDYELTIAY